MYTNSDNSLLKKMDYLKGIFATQDIQAAGVTEIKPKYGTIPPKQLLEIEGYDCFLNAHYEDPDTRGVIIYTKQHLKAQLVTSEICATYKDSVWIKIPIQNNADMLVGCVYRSGSKEKAHMNDKNLHNMLKHMSLKSGYKCIVIMGDFNYPNIDWTPDPVITINHRSESHPEHLFVNTINDCYLHQHVTLPTRDREGQQSKTDDLLFTNDKDMLLNVEHIGHLGESDHQILTFDIQSTFRKFTKKSHTRMKYHQTNIEGFKRCMNIDWERELNDKSAEEAYNCFLNKYNEACKENVPTVTFQTKEKFYKPIWMKPATLNLIRRKKSAHIKYLNTKARWDKLRYNSMRNQVTSATRQDRVAFERNLTREIKNNNKLFWRYVNSQRTSRSTLPDLQRKDGTFTADDKEKAELLNDQFTGVFTEEDLNNIPEIDPLPVRTNLSNILITEQEVKKQLKGLRTNKSCGADKVHPYLLQKLSDDMAVPLTKIFNMSLNSGLVPSIWKEGIISAIFKKGNKSLPSNYRAITLTSVVCKIMEKIIVIKIHKHLKENDLEDKHQHGFTPKKSTISNLIEALNIWTEAVSHGIPVDIIYLDYEKAFDKVPHRRLVKQLSKYGITGNVQQWIKDYLHNRTQRVRVNGQFSTTSRVLSGVPQGSVLGPLLFLIFVADMAPIVQNFISLYADDTKLFSYMLESNTSASIQEDINKLSSWSDKMQMSFNPEKCHRLHLGKNNKQHPYFLPKIYATTETPSSISYTLYLHRLENVPDEKDLGVFVDRKLNFKKHISQKISKANSMLFLIKNTFKHLDKNMFKLLYKSLVRPHLEYASCIWNPISKEDSIRIERVQRKATKFVPGLSTLSYPDRLKELELPSLHYRRLRTDLIFIYNYINQNILLETKTHCKFCQNSDLMLAPITAGTRGHPFRFKIHRLNTIRARFITGRTLHHWNNLSASTVTACSLNSFKTRLRQDTSMPSQYTIVDYGVPNIS